jgi:hypothetical protein
MLKTGYTVSNGFNKLEHQCPVYSNKGFEIPIKKGFENGKILASSIEIPKAWGEVQQTKRTVTSLKRKRKIIPDPSYDLTGDGTVSAKEYLIAKIFDKDGDGILNDEEKAECIKQLKDGYEKKFLFGLDGQLASVNYGKNQTDVVKNLVKQVNGKIIRHEYYTTDQSLDRERFT